MQDLTHIPLTVIIPTLADSARAHGLMQAIASVKQQTEVASEVLVVVNGQRFDPALLAALQTRHDIRLLQLEEASLVAAILRGRQAVRTPFFAFLDDDDEYLPGTLQARLSTLAQHPACAMVVSRGWRELRGERAPSAENLARALGDPYVELARNNWMTSCGGLYRSDMVPPELFSGVPRHHEWTYLAYRLVALAPFCIVDQPGYVIHDSPVSLSKSTAYGLAHAQVLREVLKLPLPEAALHSVRERLARAEHDLACQALRDGQRIQAFKHHLKSLSLPGGLRYLSFSRHVLLTPRSSH